MKNPSIENLIEHNKRIVEKCKTIVLGNSAAESQYKAMGWIDALNYITRYYKLEEK